MTSTWSRFSNPCTGTATPRQPVTLQVTCRVHYEIQTIGNGCPLGTMRKQTDSRVAVVAWTGIEDKHSRSEYAEWTHRALDGPALAATMIAHVEECAEAGIAAV